jgi:hypothetical protein
MIAFIEFPIETVGAIRHGFARRRFIVLGNHIPYHTRNLVRSSSDPPPEIPNRVVCARFPSVTHTLHGVSSNCAHRRVSVATSHEDWVGRVPEMEPSRASSLLVRPDMVTRRSRKTKSRGRHCFARRLKRHHRNPVRQSHKGAGRTAQRVSREPYVCQRIYLRYVSIYLLGSIVIPILVLQSFHNTGRIASECRRLAVAYLQPTITSTLSAAAAEEQVVVYLVVCRGPGSIENRRG